MPAHGSRSFEGKSRKGAFSITRMFDAPRALVFSAWTELDHLTRWWGPKGFAWIDSSIDLRPGGVFHYCMRSPDGHDMWGKVIYREIAAPGRIVFINSFSDKDRNTLRHPASPAWPLEVLNTITLTERDGKTTFTLQGIPVNATEEEQKAFENGHHSLQEAFKGTLDQLEDYLANIR